MHARPAARSRGTASGLGRPKPSVGEPAIDGARSLADPATASLQTLDELPAGSRCTVARVEEADEALAIRLKTMGLHEGRTLMVLRAGDRLVVACGATRIGMAASVAGRVVVRRTDV